jgi:hypothetical protein
MNDNQEILNAIQGVSTKEPDTTLSTGIAGSNMPAVSGGGGLPAPTGAGQATPSYMNTMQGILGGPQQFNPLQQMYSPMIRHGIGKDNWSSSMGLDQQSILNNIGLGGQQ